LHDVEDFLGEGGIGDRPGWGLLVGQLRGELRWGRRVAVGEESCDGRGELRWERRVAMGEESDCGGR
jgi:hypothetical protein